MNATCPTCRKTFDLQASLKSRPFCCERCKMADLGRWLDEGYRLSRAPEGEEVDELVAQLDRQFDA